MREPLRGVLLVRAREIRCIDSRNEVVGAANGVVHAIPHAAADEVASRNRAQWIADVAWLSWVDAIDVATHRAEDEDLEFVAQAIAGEESRGASVELNRIQRPEIFGRVEVRNRVVAARDDGRGNDREQCR